MPRDSSGNYTLPGGNPVVTGTVITSTWANPTMSDIANEIENSLSRDGQGGMRAPLPFLDGTKSDPAVTFVSEPTLGIYRDATGVFGIAAVGNKMLLVDGNNKTSTFDGQARATDAAPVDDSDLTRKDYVDAAIATLTGAIFPVGSFYIGPDPNGTIAGTWVQLPEGTFLMNTIGGADPSGGDNDAAVISHNHSMGSAGSHSHGVSDPGHLHNTTIGKSASSTGSGGASGESAPGVNTTSASTGISINSAGSHSHTINSTGESASGRNRPAYRGVEVWERTA